MTTLSAALTIVATLLSFFLGGRYGAWKAKRDLQAQYDAATKANAERDGDELTRLLKELEEGR